MKNSLLLVLFFLLNGAPAVLSQRSGDAVAVDPTHHHVIMENDHVRVFEVLAAPGAKSPMHTHPPLVVISLGTARLRMAAPDGSRSILDLHPAQVLWLENVEHSWELLSGQVHVVAVEVKAAGQGLTPVATAPRATDAVAVDPTHHHVIMENDHVRVFEVLAAPGAKSPMHTHPPLVVISLGTARLRMTAPDGSRSILDLHPAQVLWLENVEHSWELLAGGVHVIAVEAKAHLPQQGR